MVLLGASRHTSSSKPNANDADKDHVCSEVAREAAEDLVRVYPEAAHGATLRSAGSGSAAATVAAPRASSARRRSSRGRSRAS